MSLRRAGVIGGEVGVAVDQEFGRLADLAEEVGKSFVGGLRLRDDLLGVSLRADEVGALVVESVSAEVS